MTPSGTATSPASRIPKMLWPPKKVPIAHAPIARNTYWHNEIWPL